VKVTKVALVSAVQALEDTTVTDWSRSVLSGQWSVVSSLVTLIMQYHRRSEHSAYTCNHIRPATTNHLRTLHDQHCDLVHDIEADDNIDTIRKAKCLRLHFTLAV